MKKLILISLFIFFAICSKSWALPECEGSPAKYGTSIVNNWNNCIGTATGISTWHSDAKYVGEFKNGKPDGYGTSSFGETGRYVGMHKENEYYGQGTFFNSDGSVWEGQWGIDFWEYDKYLKKYPPGEYQRIQAQKEAKKKRAEVEEERRIRKLKKKRIEESLRLKQQAKQKQLELERIKIEELETAKRVKREYDYAKEQEDLGNYELAIKSYKKCYASIKLCRENYINLTKKNKKAVEIKPNNKATNINRNIDSKIITLVQSKLISLGYNIGSVDGKIGSKTKQAILDFEKDNSLKVTGQISNNLIKELNKRNAVSNTLPKNSETLLLNAPKDIATINDLELCLHHDVRPSPDIIKEVKSRYLKCDKLLEYYENSKTVTDNSDKKNIPLIEDNKKYNTTNIDLEQRRKDELRELRERQRLTQEKQYERRQEKLRAQERQRIKDEEYRKQRQREDAIRSAERRNYQQKLRQLNHQRNANKRKVDNSSDVDWDAVILQGLSIMQGGFNSGNSSSGSNSTLDPACYNNCLLKMTSHGLCKKECSY
jgi:peptidoglycan hydrolase-like protein with peptidoglycan-binding domain